MKHIVLSVFLSLSFQPIRAQNENTPVERTKMEIFTHWAGSWTGEATMKHGGGPSQTSMVEEIIQSKLDGTIVTMEGIGKSTSQDSSKVVHHAFGVLSYDKREQKYKLKSYLADGRSTDAWFEVKNENHYQWGFDVPAGKIRYSITMSAGGNTWYEVGEFTSDNTTWYKFFEMNLSKKS